MLVERDAQRGTNLLVAKSAPAKADEGKSFWEEVAYPQVEESRYHLAVGEVTRCAKEDHHMGIRNALNAQSGTKWILRPLLYCRLSSLAAKPQITNRCVSLSG